MTAGVKMPYRKMREEAAEVLLTVSLEEEVLSMISLDSEAIREVEREIHRKERT